MFFTILGYIFAIIIGLAVLVCLIVGLALLVSKLKDLLAPRKIKRVERFLDKIKSGKKKKSLKSLLKIKRILSRCSFPNAYWAETCNKNLVEEDLRGYHEVSDCVTCPLRSQCKWEMKWKEKYDLLPSKKKLKENWKLLGKHFWG